MAGAIDTRPCCNIVFPDSWIEVREESGIAERLSLGAGDTTRGGTVRREGGAVSARRRSRRWLPSTCGNWRMQAFNEFWVAHVPGLRPTAGYPVDARRFVAQIRDRQQQLGISDNMLWRTR